jgi:hypothetical protein
MKPHVHECVHACELAGLQPEEAAGLSGAADFAFRGVLIRWSMSCCGSPGDRASAARLGGFNDACHGGSASAEKVISPNILQRVGDWAEGGNP